MASIAAERLHTAGDSAIAPDGDWPRLALGGYSRGR